MKEYIEYARQIVSERCMFMPIIKAVVPAHRVMKEDIDEIVERLKAYPFDRSDLEIKNYRAHTYLLINNWKNRVLKKYFFPPDIELKSYFMPDIEFHQLITTIENVSKKHFPQKKAKK